MFSDRATEVVTRYNEILKRRLPEVIQYRRLCSLDSELVARCFVEMPLFIERSKLAAIESSLRVLLSCCRRVVTEYCGGDFEELYAILGLASYFNSELCNNIDLDDAFFIARPDGFLTSSGYKVIEQNISSVVGSFQYVERAATYFDSHPVLAELRSEFSISRPSYYSSLLASLKARFGSEVSIGILDVSSTFSYEIDSCGVSLVSELKALGHDKVYWGVPSSFEIHNTSLCVSGHPVDVVLRLYHPKIFSQEVATFGSFYPHRSRTRVLSPPIDQALWDKRFLVLLKKLAQECYFGSEDSAIVDNMIPYSERVSASAEQAVFLDPERYIVKPADSDNGDGFTWGGDCSAEEWKGRINDLGDSDRWIVQEAVHGLSLKLPVIKEERLFEFFARPLFSPFLINGEIASVYCSTYGTFFEGGKRDLLSFKGPFSRVPAFVIDD